ncbi:MAG: sulfatase-like hydrolase/transferase [Gemmatimonadales bacterium]
MQFLASKSPSRPAAPPAPVLDVVLYAAGFALASGLAYWLIQLIRGKVLGQFVWVSPDAVWMAPLAYLALFIPLVLPAWAAARIRGGAPLAAGGFAWLSVFSLLLPFPQIARWAAAILATGVALQVARAVRASGPRRRFGAIACLAMAGFATLGAGVRLTIDGLARRQALGRLPSAPAGAPNVLLIVWDTVREENLSLHGHDRPTTPTLERLAATSAVFERAIATAPWTLPSHGTLFTGHYGEELGTHWRRPLAAGVPTLAEIFSRHGYRTGGFVANLLYTSRESGLGRGFIDYRDYRVSPRLVLQHSPIAQTGSFRRLLTARSMRDVRRAFTAGGLVTGRLPADDVVPAHTVTDDFLRWQASLDGRPFLAFLNYFDAHGPYRAPDSVRQRLGLSSRPEDRYDAAIAHLDGELAHLLEALVQRGALERTIVVVTSDHGELFGEHGLTGHANALYLPLLRVPLLIRYPAAVPGGVRVGAAVSLRDVAATITGLAGLEPDPAPPGQSLASHWTGGNGPGSAIVAELGQGMNVDSTFPNARTDLASIMDQRYHYIRDGLGAEQLFDYLADPAEATNLSRVPAEAETLRRLRRSLDSVVRR